MTQQKFLLIAFICLAGNLAWATVFTLRQYRAWNTHEFSRFFLTTHVDEATAPWTAPWNRLSDAIGGTPGGYFLYYAWGRFWLPALIFITPPIALYTILVLVGALYGSNKKFFTQSAIVFAVAAAVSIIVRLF